MAAAIGPWSVREAIEGIVMIGFVVVLTLIALAAWRSGG